KTTGLGLPEAVSREYGAVSAEVTKGLAEGALAHSTAGVSVAVTGYAGPGGGNEKNPVGTGYVAAARKGAETLVERHVFSGDRDTVRIQAVGAALTLLVRRLAWWSAATINKATRPTVSGMVLQILRFL